MFCCLNIVSLGHSKRPPHSIHVNHFAFYNPTGRSLCPENWQSASVEFEPRTLRFWERCTILLRCSFPKLYMIKLQAFKLYMIKLQAFKLYIIKLQAFKLYMIKLQAFKLYMIKLQTFKLYMIRSQAFKLYMIKLQGFNKLLWSEDLLKCFPDFLNVVKCF